jgi:hypothetical protein
VIVATLDTLDIDALAAAVARSVNAERVIALDELSDLLDETLETMRSEAGPASNPASLVHVITGRMVNSFRTAGPYPVGRNTLEGQIVAGVPYAIDEINRGGTHDYASRTIAFTTQERKRVAERLAQRIIDAIKGRP